MVLTKYRNSLQDTGGNAVAGAVVTVTLTATAAAAKLYADAAGLTPLAGNTVLTDDRGMYSFYAPPARYSMGFAKSGVSLGTDADVSVDEQFETPEKYGATGLGTTDDGPALALAVATGRNVYLAPDRVYLMNGRTLTPAANKQRFFGGGKLRKTSITTGGEAFIAINGFNDIKVEGIEFEDTRTSGARSYGVTVINSLNSKVWGCTFSGYETPVFVWRLSGGTQVIGNTMTGGDFGVATGGDSAGNTNGVVSNTTIAYNVIRGMRGEGIDINWDTQGCKVLYNEILGCGTVDGEEDIDIGGGVCRDIEIIGNTLDSGGNCDNNIWVKLDTQRVTISKNTLRGATVNGILAGTGGSTIRHLWITDDNKINGGGTATGRGIELNDCAGFKVNKNLVWGFLGDAITALSTSSGGEIDGNHATECDDGVVCLAPRTRITGNHAYLNSRVGINLQATDLICIANHVYDNAVTVDDSYGMVITAGSDRSIIALNKVYDTRGTTRQNGVIATGFSDRLTVFGNTVRPFKVWSWYGMEVLTNSQLDGNIPETNPLYIVLADDTAHSLTPPNTSGFIEVWAETSSTHYGKRYYRAGASPAMANVYSGAAFASTTGALTGTTGSDGNLTISALSDGTINIENRSGASQTVCWAFTARQL